MTGKKRRLWFTISCAALLMLALNYQPIHQYIDVIKNHKAVTADGRVDERERLRGLIEQWKSGKEEMPIDAVFDKSWKAAVPGYNGRIVDVEASVSKMIATGTVSPEMMVYKELPPAVSLEQLGTLPIYRGNPNKPAISFMINVAWGNEYLDSMLDILDKHGVKTTFFLDGSWVKRYPEEAKKIAARGHEIGNHAYSHPDMNTLGMQRIHQEISKTQDIIQKTIGVKPTLFAPPSGAFNQRVVQIAQSSYQMKTILWTADTVDWQKPSSSWVIRKISRLMGNGVLVLMHPTAASEASLDQLLTIAKQKGLVPTTVSEVISSNRLGK
ncbi:polysaccharide deacetylase family protein [Brevibacillus choshinensis]|uniref:Polysaccharide deacetylase family protein n=1 Tax=Brevibacillus choshinensis TaxID=54911 RepID=A0ABX7FHV1_BRECH|nr:polysaccharide deacetylase family protein [Brevibacillus choshinensis]QRG65445.1 polysaccharide deacetylase family protein [Brevibacillus choshinensis]